MTTRYDISCDTGSATDKDASGNYFDQMLGMSQGIINASFQDLFNSVEEICELYEDNRMLGQIEAVLNAPTIMINGSSDNATEIIYQLRIKSGTVYFKSGEQRTMTDWVLSVRTFLNDVSLEILDGDLPGMKAKKKLWMEDVKNSYPGFRPGDYSVQRVFAALGSAGWRDPDQVLSTCFDEETQKTITFQEWAAKPGNKDCAGVILTLLASWAAGQESDKKSTLGIKFKLPETKVAQNNPTFRPVYIHNQVYPYFNKDGKGGHQSVGDYSQRDQTRPYGRLADGDYNCLLYCENVDRISPEAQAQGITKARPLPVNRKIGYNGNMAEPAHGSEPDTYGSFVMDHRVFLASFMLPQLQELCLSTFTQIGAPAYAWVESTKMKSFQPTYAIGNELGGSVPRSADDPFFGFQQQGPSSYMWRQESLHSNFDNPFEFFQSPGMWWTSLGYGAHSIKAKSSVTVDWTAGEPHLNVRGEVVYDYWLRFSAPNDKAFTGSTVSNKKYTCKATWTVQVVLDEPEKGVMRPRIAGVNTDGAPLDTAANLTDLEVDKDITGDTQNDIRNSLQDALKRGIAVINNNIAQRFNNAGCFTYPGHGELVFKNPRFTRLGGVIARVEYQRPTGPDGTMSFPKPNRTPVSMTQPSVPGAVTKKFSETLTHTREPALTWSVGFKYNPELKIGSLTLGAVNKTSSPISFTYIEIHLPSKTSGDNNGKMLFDGKVWAEESEPSVLEAIFRTGKYTFNRIVSMLTTAGDADKSTEVGKTGQAPQQQEGMADQPKSLSVQQSGTPESSKKDDEARKLEKEDVMTKSGNMYSFVTVDQFSKAWSPEARTAPHIDISSEVGALVVRLNPWTKPAPRKGQRADPDAEEEDGEDSAPASSKSFEIPKGKGFTIELQGAVPAIGEYAIKIHEAWKLARDKARFAVDYKMVEIKQNKDGKLEWDAWDVSDRLKEEKAKAEK